MKSLSMYQESKLHKVNMRLLQEAVNAVCAAGLHVLLDSPLIFNPCPKPYLR